jgi:hypothetical protein
VDRKVGWGREALDMDLTKIWGTLLKWTEKCEGEGLQETTGK